MRVAIFTDTFTPEINGVARATARQTDYFKTNSIPYLVIAPDYGRPNSETEENTITISSLRFPLYSECRVALPRTNTIIDRIKDFSPDVIHLSTPFFVGLCGLKLAQKLGIARVASYHTDLPGYLTYYRLGLLKGLAWQYLRWFHNQCQLNICPSGETAGLIKQKGILNTRVCGNGVDTELFNPLRFNQNARRKLVPDGKIAFLYVGRLAAEKNIDILMQAFAQVSCKYPWAHLVITGGGPILGDLKASAPPGVTFTGYLEGIALAEVYASSDIFVFPSTTETYGLVVLEALASGLPVIAPYEGGLKENLKHDYNGLACKPLDVADLARAMEVLLNNSSLRFRLAQNARPFALQKSWDHVIGELVENYKEVVLAEQKTA
jgi:glycosyltransferase involved in cell wall biosynthesis